MDDGRTTGLENTEYFTSQLITYIGNKRALLRQILEVIDTVRSRLGGKFLRAADLFSGSGVVARLLKEQSSFVISNDLEPYARAVGECYLANRGELSGVDLAGVVRRLNDEAERLVAAPEQYGFFEELYSPRDETRITASDRVFYTRDNARRIDIYRMLLEKEPEQIKKFLLGPLLSEASVHTNTAGVFKGFYKHKDTGVGQFGGSGKDALSRILGKIALSVPVLSDTECEYRVIQRDANEAARELPEMDLVYLDPPYNQHPYGSNYFMLNLIVSNERPEKISRVSGIPQDWQRSGYNVRGRAFELFCELARVVPTKFLLVSYNNEGFISPAMMQSALAPLGNLEIIACPYNTFRGSRNLGARSKHVTEFLYLVEKK